MALYPVKPGAHMTYCAEVNGPPETRELWSNSRAAMFQYWLE